ncbi:WG repeat-containing protein [Elizabethkingia sp. JS20170427COW]|uniref:WG repeat-containing protein n=1 Tax=Elizabethkingia sp. JS20170427COW TaxID=2583851 RepID=UPI001110AAAC|nr:WG repeat-containing protein [Elizabethkingia sp. JS20170427COW]QCX53254.1 WG repeat-containing protein [Elizabethkingia sp. JS20170427COW]
MKLKLLFLAMVVSSLFYGNIQSFRRLDRDTLKEQIPELIPKKSKGKFGYINTQKKYVISPQYDLALFFTEDCNLVNSPKEEVQAYGSAEYATVEINKVAYRIDKSGKKVYRYKQGDLGICPSRKMNPVYETYERNGKYGLALRNYTGDSRFTNVIILSSYQYLYILEGGDVHQPMIIAVQNDKFGIITKDNQVVIPFEYEDIKKNMSWKEAHLFEVSKNGRNYFFLDKEGNSY